MNGAGADAPLDPRALRAAFGSFMTGVTVVTTRDSAGQAVGFTANSFTSVSLDPPLLLVCPGRFLSSFAAFEACEVFAVSILAEGQEEVSNTFASFKGDRFAQVDTEDDLHRVPVIAGAAAVFSCRTRQVIDAGDHALLIGQVRDFRHSGGRGLGYAGGTYFSLGLEHSAAHAPRQGLKNVASAIIEQDGAVYLQGDASGYFLPRVVVGQGGLLRDALQAHLATLRLDAHLAQVYSIYDLAAAGEHHTCFRATASGAAPRDGVFVPVGDLAGLTYAVPGQAATLARYATEYQTGLFGLYVGDSDTGEVHYS